MTIVKAEYLTRQFGSWWIIVKVKNDFLRIVWNSRDQWVLIQLKTKEIFDNQYIWKDEWVLKRSEDHYAEPIFTRFRKIYKKINNR